MYPPILLSGAARRNWPYPEAVNHVEYLETISTIGVAIDFGANLSVLDFLCWMLLSARVLLLKSFDKQHVVFFVNMLMHVGLKLFQRI